MKKKLLFTFACVIALMAGFVSCTNDDFEEFAPVAEMQKSAMTRSVGGMSKEEVQARLDELGEKYGINIKMLYVRDYSEFTESTFEKMEQNIIAFKNREVNTTALSAMAVDDNLLDDGVIDEYDIATLSTNVEPAEDYDFTFDFVVEYYSHYIDNINKYRWGLNFTEGSNWVLIDADLMDVNTSIPVILTQPCPVSDFRHGAVTLHGGKRYSFDFEFDILNPRTIIGVVYGEYDNGLKDIWAMTSGAEVVIGLPDLNE